MRIHRSLWLLPLGITIVALGVALRQYLQHARPAIDHDFALGAFVGVGLGLLILNLWRNRPRAVS
ncbi:MAG: hypothetical protein JOZ54_21970 [Acidobacteria bacterium]|nr:hypothetical protein [Acidobacteriota bacterium]